MNVVKIRPNNCSPVILNYLPGLVNDSPAPRAEEQPKEAKKKVEKVKGMHSEARGESSWRITGESNKKNTADYYLHLTCTLKRGPGISS